MCTRFHAFLTASALVSLTLASAASSSAAVVSHVDLAISGRRDYAFGQDGILYVTANDSIVRYDTRANAFRPPFVVGGTLIGLDISPDGQVLAAADSSVQGTNNRIHLVDTATGADSPVSFPLAFSEGGTFMVAWGADGRILITSYFNGSGWVPLRRYDPNLGTTALLGSVRQNTMLAPSADRATISLAESNISSGPVHVYDVASGALVASVNTGWSMFEVATSPTGRYLIAPSYFGAFVFGRSQGQLVQLGVIGQYANWGPLAAAFSPRQDVLYTAEFGNQPGVKVYSLPTLQHIATLDPYPFPWSGNGSMGEGRMKIGPGGRKLAVSIAGGTRLYSL